MFAATDGDIHLACRVACLSDNLVVLKQTVDLGALDHQAF